jgi:hypothetical protein
MSDSCLLKMPGTLVLPGVLLERVVPLWQRIPKAVWLTILFPSMASRLRVTNVGCQGTEQHPPPPLHARSSPVITSKKLPYFTKCPPLQEWVRITPVSVAKFHMALDLSVKCSSHVQIIF